MNEARVFAPGHLTGFFQICDKPSNPIHKGSRGAGVSIKQGTTTFVRTNPAENTNFEIMINGEVAKDPVVSEAVVKKYISRLSEPAYIQVEHKVETPIMAGFGSSGGGALSLSLALNKALEIGLTRVEAAQIAHIAEIECRTGLGSVFAAYKGGFGVLYEPGAPGIGKSKSYEGSEELRVIYVYYGPIPTREALNDPDLRRKINELGGTYVDELYKEFTPERFLRFSRQFTEHLGLVTPKIRRVFNCMDPKGITFTMAMFGEVAFTVQPVELTAYIMKIINKEDLGGKPNLTSVDMIGSIILN
jgi:pantoate kinase